MNLIKERLQQKKSFIDEVGTSKNNMIEKNAYMYHVVQQLDNKRKLFNQESAMHRDILVKNLCVKYNVIPIASVILPTHTHDIFIADDISNISNVLRYANRGTSTFIRNERAQKNMSELKHIFVTCPGYVAIKTRQQLMYLVKYLYDNPAYLKQSGEYIPYSCFDSWEKNYFKPYDIALLEKILEIDITQILELCKTLDKEHFESFCRDKYEHDSSQLNDNLFMKDKSLGWSF